MNSSGFYPSKGNFINKRYEVIDVLDSGGTGIVLACLDTCTNKKAAIKRYYPDKLTTELSRKAFEESKLSIKSDYLVMSYKTFYEDSFLHSVMHFVEGETLYDILNTNNTVTLTFAVYTALCISKACFDLHSYGIISTDIKPENIIVTPNGISILIDLSCFEVINNKAGVSQGTPPYAPYELLSRSVLYASTDIYSISVVLFEMLVGFDEFEKMSRDLELAAIRGTKPDISIIKSNYSEILPIVDKAIEPDPKNRYSNANELFNELLSFYNTLNGTSTKKPKIRLVCKNGKEIYLNQGNTVLGRDDFDKTLIYISQEHIEFDYDGNGSLKIRDCNSSNGTILNSKRIGNNWVNINDTDVIHVASFEIVVRISK